MEYDLYTTDWILEKVKDNFYAYHLSYVLRNFEFTPASNILEILADNYTNFSYSKSLEIVTNMKNLVSHRQWNTVYMYADETINEAMDDIKKLGWTIHEWRQ